VKNVGENGTREGWLSLEKSMGEIVDKEEKENGFLAYVFALRKSQEEEESAPFSHLGIFERPGGWVRGHLREAGEPVDGRGGKGRGRWRRGWVGRIRRVVHYVDATDVAIIEGGVKESGTRRREPHGRVAGQYFLWTKKLYVFASFQEMLVKVIIKWAESASALDRTGTDWRSGSNTHIVCMDINGIST